MAIVRLLKPVRVRGEIVRAGEMLKTEKEGFLIETGCARRLTKAETTNILGQYAIYAGRLFDGRHR